jgi:hypothetical protein
MPECVNLREQFGDRFIVKFEESYAADLGKGIQRGDPWLMILPCCGGRGHIGPWSATELVACADKPRLAKALLALGFGRVAQDGDDGLNFVFQLSDFEAVAKILQPRRRRRLPDHQRAANAKRLRRLAAEHRDNTSRAKLGRRRGRAA